MAAFDVRAIDDDEDDHSNDFTASDEGWFTPTDFPGLNAVYDFFLKHYNKEESDDLGATGSGLFDPFLRTGNNVVAGTSIGFNTDEDYGKAQRQPWRHAGTFDRDPGARATLSGCPQLAAAHRRRNRSSGTRRAGHALARPALALGVVLTGAR